MLNIPESQTTEATKQIQLFGLQFESTTLEGAARQVVELAKSRYKCLIVTPNVDHIVTMDIDKDMLDIFQSAKYRYADGMPLVWLSQLMLAKGLPERVTGADLLPEIAHLASLSGLKIFLMGGQPGEAEAASSQLKLQYQDLLICGINCPPFGFEKDAAASESIIREINSAQADILFIGVGTPKQEKWASQYLHKLNVGPVLGVGAAFAFTAGTIRRAPKWMQSFGLEWAWRIALEPIRMSRRYLIKDVKFFHLAFREFCRHKAEFRKKRS